MRNHSPLAINVSNLVASALVAIALFVHVSNLHAQNSPKSPLDAKRALSYLKKICDIGPRVTGTKGMAKQQDLLVDHFSKLGPQLVWQEFEMRHPETVAK